jgi:DNA replication protein DnaC
VSEFYPLLVIEAGCIPVRTRGVNLFFQFVSSHYERASRSSPATSHPWGEAFGDDVVTGAMIDQLVHHADNGGSAMIHLMKTE